MAAWAAIQEEAKAAEASHREEKMLNQEKMEEGWASQQKLDEEATNQNEAVDDTAMELEAMELDEGDTPKADRDKGKATAGPSGTSQRHGVDLDKLRDQLQKCDELRAQLARAIQHRASQPTAAPAIIQELEATVEAADVTEPGSSSTGTKDTAGDGARDEADSNFEFRTCSKGAWHLQLPKEYTDGIYIQLDLDPDADEMMRDMAAEEQ